MTAQRHPKQRQGRRLPVLLYLPNILGYIRIVFAFIGLYYSILHRPIIAILIWVLASVLDLFDGILARRLQQTSQFGILLDIVADNILRSIIYVATCNAASIAYYISTIPITEIDRQPNHWMVSSNSSTTIGIIIISCFIICLEWITMISTQLYTVYQASFVDTAAIPKTTTTTTTSKESSPHWKKIVTTNTGSTTTNRPSRSFGTKEPINEEWWIVQYYFSNNFCNPMGIIGIYGLFAWNLFLYGCYYPVVYEQIPYYNVWMYLAFIGRWLSFVIELKFCYRFVNFMISKED